MIRWSELSLGSRLAGRNTRFSLVFHTEGLANPKVFRRILEFGRMLPRECRPLMTLITPHCPQYRVDPLADPERVDFLYREPTSASEKDFEGKLTQLADHYDFGYHGHFFETVDGRCRPTFDAEKIRPQFGFETNYLDSIGHRPRVYAGGWWFFSHPLEALLAEGGFHLDTTLNDVHLDSFSRPQPFPSATPGRPFRLLGGVVEIPSVRSIAGLKRVLLDRRKQDNFVVLSLHDYDLMGSSLDKALSRSVIRLLKTDSVRSADEMVSDALTWLSTFRENPAGRTIGTSQSGA